MVEERRSQLERVERGLLPSAEHEEYREQAKPAEPLDWPEKQQMDLMFEKLKSVTGAKNPEEVLSKFKVQGETKKRLTELKQTTERDKKELEMRKLSMEAEIESNKFAEVKEKERSDEEIEAIQTSIVEKEAEVVQIGIECDALKKKLFFIKEILHDLCIALMVLDTTVVPRLEPDNVQMDDLIQLFKNKLAVLLQAKDQIRPVQPTKDDKLDPSGMMEVVLDPRRGKKAAREGAPDVPSRAQMKRQSQLYVEAMTRRKGYQQKAAERK